MRILLNVTLIVFSATLLQAQTKFNTTVFGLTVKPIVPSDYFRTGKIEFSDNNVEYTVLQKSGFSFGAIVRHNFSKLIALEAGIQYAKRNYEYTLSDSAYSGKNDFTYIGYELPLNVLTFIQLGQKTYMNAALGVSFDIYPSDVYTYDREDNFYQQYGARPVLFNAGLNANIGTEYRTSKSGTIYLGLAYHRSFSPIMNNIIEYYPSQDFSRTPLSTGRSDIQGDYLTIDLRYYFHQDPEKKKAKKKKKKTKSTDK